MKVKVSCYYGFAGCDREDELELPDGLSDKEINEEVWNWACEWVDYSYEVIEGGESD